MAAFKPLTKNEPVIKADALSSKTKEDEAFDALMNSTKLPDIIKTTEERIHLIFDDSGSMAAIVPGSAEPGLDKTFNNDPYGKGYSDQDKSRIELAKEATIDYMKNCKPRVSAVEIAFLNAEQIDLSKNLPKIAADLKKITDAGGTPLYEFLGKMVDAHPTKKYTRALIFTDGEASNYSRPNIFTELRAMRIPIDLILIGKIGPLSQNEADLKSAVEASGGTFLICKDANDFKKKMKYFAPLLRHQLAAIASDNSFGS